MIESVNTLEDILEPHAGQTVYNESDGKVYRWDPIENWQYIPEDSNTTFAMTAYDLNKQIIGQLQILDVEEIAKKKQMIYNFCENTQNRFYMLLCRELNYYTVFYRNPDLGVEYIADVVKECADTLGEIKVIDPTEDGMAIEIWVTNPNWEDSTHALYFFPYDGGVEICM